MDDEMKEVLELKPKEKEVKAPVSPPVVEDVGSAVVLELVVSRVIDSKYLLMKVKGSDKAADYRLVPYEVYGKGVKEVTLTRTAFAALEKPADWATPLVAAMPTAESVAIELWKAGVVRPTAVGRGNSHVFQAVVHRVGPTLNDIIAVIANKP